MVAPAVRKIFGFGLLGAVALSASAALASNKDSILTTFNDSCLSLQPNFESATGQMTTAGWQVVSPDKRPVLLAVAENYSDPSKYASIVIFEKELDGVAFHAAIINGLPRTMSGTARDGMLICRMFVTYAEGPFDEDVFAGQFDPLLRLELQNFVTIGQQFFASETAAATPPSPLGGKRSKVDRGLTGLVLTASQFLDKGN
jgi:hypothetical protein